MVFFLSTCFLHELAFLFIQTIAVKIDYLLTGILSELLYLC